MSALLMELAVGRVAGQSSTSQAHEYGLVDAKVLYTDTVYYRLRQVDQNGATRPIPPSAPATRDMKSSLDEFE